jgi:hypothetical protein
MLAAGGRRFRYNHVTKQFQVLPDARRDGERQLAGIDSAANELMPKSMNERRLE